MESPDKVRFSSYFSPLQKSTKEMAKFGQDFRGLFTVQLRNAESVNRMLWSLTLNAKTNALVLLWPVAGVNCGLSEFSV